MHLEGPGALAVGGDPGDVAVGFVAVRHHPDGVATRCRRAPTRTTSAPSRSCPSRNTLARTGKGSPAVALAGRRPRSTKGMTSMTGMRPTMLATLPNRHPACKRRPVPGPGRTGDDFVRALGNWNDQVNLGYRPSVRAIRRFTVRPVLPPALAALGDLAGNLRWSWHPPTQDVFAEVDPELWEATRHDPVRLLGAVNPARLEAAGRATRTSSTGSARRRPTSTPTSAASAGTPAGPAPTHRPRIAYFSPEFGITAVLPQYSGGLGILAGDHLKAASDLGVPARSASGCSTSTATSSSRSPARAGSRRATPSSTPTSCPSRCCARRTATAPDLHRPARRARAARADLGRPGRPRAAAAARLRRRGQPRPLPRGHRPALRRHHRAPAAPGDAARRRRRPGPARLRADHRRTRSPRCSTPTRATPASSVSSGSAS